MKLTISYIWLLLTRKIEKRNCISNLFLSSLWQTRKNFLLPKLNWQRSCGCFIISNSRLFAETSQACCSNGGPAVSQLSYSRCFESNLTWTPVEECQFQRAGRGGGRRHRGGELRDKTRGRREWLSRARSRRGKVHVPFVANELNDLSLGKLSSSLGPDTSGQTRTSDRLARLPCPIPTTKVAVRLC